MKVLVSKDVCVSTDTFTIHKGCGTMMIDIKEGSTVRWHSQVTNDKIDEFILALQEYQAQVKAQHTL
jgi:hypothetical protein